jgi:hypothetical protein
MPSILLGLGKGSKVRKFVLEMDKNYDVQRTKKDNNVSKVVVFLLSTSLSDGLAIVHKSPRWWQT